jgi:signal peptidase II
VRAATETTRTLAAMGLIALVVVIADLIVKRVVTSTLGPDANRHASWLVDDILGLEYVQNSGAAFGIMRGNPELLAAVSLLVGGAFVWLLLKELGSGPWSAASGGLLIGGGIGNLVERFGDGYVTDYIAVGPWPRFNIADSAITVAIAIFAVALFVDSGASTGDEATRYGQTSEEQRDGQA